MEVASHDYCYSANWVCGPPCQKVASEGAESIRADSLRKPRGDGKTPAASGKGESVREGMPIILSIFLFVCRLSIALRKNVRDIFILLYILACHGSLCIFLDLNTFLNYSRMGFIFAGY